MERQTETMVLKFRKYLLNEFGVSNVPCGIVLVTHILGYITLSKRTYSLLSSMNYEDERNPVRIDPTH